MLNAVNDGLLTEGRCRIESRSTGQADRVEKRGERMSREDDQRGWAAIIFASNVADVIGAIRRSTRLHWTQRAARQEAERWAAEMALGPIAWESLDEQVTMGRTHRNAVVVSSFLLPLDSPEKDEK